jgi:hypothetical protein
MERMAQITKLVLTVVALTAFGWALTDLKPLPQATFVVLPLLALMLDAWAGPPLKRITFLVASSITTLFGFLFAGSMLVTFAEHQLFPSDRRGMPIVTLIIGAAAGLGLFAFCFFWILRPSANVDRERRAGITAIAATALLAVALDRFV